ncbi:YiiX/YebB-like N1pC/P60 family cysteine hydrolase [Formosa sp. PL04]|uniref:YiiX/YebB-like N1pC/P60 family cysteine hydrolase n=1 Tax=Formosa sp. PL04 TaxID=3081755 RepID=UPI0029828167|nr:YiiX/YebB-like N1pC/P60 family cysteine hydrolase [Formosa sp. PL04]MDW5287659.1 YiiX/YebB-like N1pC/P60 family cysteine hydrolase [Formosa sp. PL04]
MYNCQSSSKFQLEEGDLLFQDGDCGPFCDAIEAVTKGINDYNFSHIGLVMKNEKSELNVMEAVSSGVVLTPLKDFLNRSFDVNKDPKVIVGRLKPEFRHLTPATIAFIKSKMKAEYDKFFDLNNDSYYCSELIHLAFKSANNNDPIFEEQPMTFIAPDTKETYAIWETYFNKLNYKIPEGELGLNPGGMSRSPFIEIVHYYGEPSKSEY